MSRNSIDSTLIKFYLSVIGYFPQEKFKMASSKQQVP